MAGARQRVLLADDNADMRDYVRRLLEERYHVTAVANGAEALRVAREARPDLVLSDVTYLRKPVDIDLLVEATTA